VHQKSLRIARWKMCSATAELQKTTFSGTYAEIFLRPCASMQFFSLCARAAPLSRRKYEGNIESRRVSPGALEKNVTPAYGRRFHLASL